MKDLPHKPDFRDKRLQKKKSSWTLIITFVTFFVSLTLGFFSDLLSKNINLYLAFLVLLIIVFIGIIFDVIGIAIASADEKPLNAMASRKIKGARQALLLIQHAEKTTNICNDVVGDISGIIAGATSVTIGTYILKYLTQRSYNSENVMLEIFVFSFVSAIAAAMTVGGKAFGKKIAIEKANDIVYAVGRMISIVRACSIIRFVRHFRQKF